MNLIFRKNSSINDIKKSIFIGFIRIKITGLSYLILPSTKKGFIGDKNGLKILPISKETPPIKFIEYWNNPWLNPRYTISKKIKAHKA